MNIIDQRRAWATNISSHMKNKDESSAVLTNLVDYLNQISSRVEMDEKIKTISDFISVSDEVFNRMTSADWEKVGVEKKEYWKDSIRSALVKLQTTPLKEKVVDGVFREISVLRKNFLDEFSDFLLQPKTEKKTASSRKTTKKTAEKQTEKKEEVVKEEPSATIVDKVEPQSPVANIKDSVLSVHPLAYVLSAFEDKVELTKDRDEKEKIKPEEIVVNQDVNSPEKVEFQKQLYGISDIASIDFRKNNISAEERTNTFKISHKKNNAVDFHSASAVFNATLKYMYDTNQKDFTLNLDINSVSFATNISFILFTYTDASLEKFGAEAKEIKKIRDNISKFNIGGVEIPAKEMFAKKSLNEIVALISQIKSHLKEQDFQNATEMLKNVSGEDVEKPLDNDGVKPDAKTNNEKENKGKNPSNEDIIDKIKKGKEY